MMPPPNHLAEIVRPKDAVLDEAPLDADVVCHCGSRVFDLLYPGQTREYDGKRIPCTAQIGKRFFFVIKARCRACEREHLLFDMDFHGWNGFVCHDAAQATAPRPELAVWTCLKCENTAHQASVLIQSEGREDFIEETDGEFDEQRWPDGFGWFAMTIVCEKCGKQSPEWVSFEAM